MSSADDRGQLDWLVELAGAVAPAAAAAYAATRLAPLHGWPLATAVLAGFGGVYGLAYLAMRAVPSEPFYLALPDFDRDVQLYEPVNDDTLLLDAIYTPLDELLLDQPLIEAATHAVAELLLDDPLPRASPESRVVQLFADGRMPTAGQLQQRIDHHLAGADHPAATVDASDALGEALAELRRSLRQA